MSFKGGALLPEEFIEEVCCVIKKERIKRIAFIDLKSIGTSYPFFINSPTSGTLFLSAFVHIMRNYGVHVIMTSSNSELQASREQLLKARILSDASIEIVAEYEKAENGEKSPIIKEVKIVGEGLLISKTSPSIAVDNDDENVLKVKFLFYDEVKDEKNIIKKVKHGFSASLFPFEID